MPGPLFLLRIVRADDPEVIATLPGGSRLEIDLIEACTQAVLRTADGGRLEAALGDAVVAQTLARPVGMFRTTAMVEAAVRAGAAAALQPALESAVRARIAAAIAALKEQTRALVYRESL